jgi:hypothetical protein
MNPLLSAWARYLRRSMDRCHSSNSRAKNNLRNNRRMLQVELLEDRTVPAYIVTTTVDSGLGSLRDAITKINADTSHTLYASPGNPNADEIDFNITAASDAAGSGAGYNATTGVATITPQVPGLPTITNAVVIDGYTQAGASGNTNSFGQADNAVLKIELNGSAVGNANGLGLNAPNITIRGLVINNFTPYAGIAIYQAPNAWIYGNFIGVDPTGEANQGNGIGVWIDSTKTVTIGSASDGHDALERNLISGSLGTNSKGIYLSGSDDTVTIQGNYLGTNATGNVAIANQGNGIYAERTNTQLHVIGNVIAGDGVSMGITLVNTTSLSGLYIQGNRIGTNAAGTAPLGNQFGIYMQGNIQDVHIGGTDTNSPGAPLAGAGNLVSGNYDGIFCSDTANVSLGVDNVTIQGNYVGTNVTGSSAIPNLFDGVGVALAGSQTATIGGLTPGTSNLISGNGRDGIGITATAGPVLIEGNRIGTTADGTAKLGNQYGAVIGASGVTVGGATQPASNIVSGNSRIGIVAGGPADLVEGNFVGTDLSGTRSVPNGSGNPNEGGLELGLSSTATGNLVSGNNGFGVQPGIGDVVQGNKIGTDVTGSVKLPNQGPGFYFNHSQNNVIGGSGAGQGNLISGNIGGGIVMLDPDDTNNTVKGNLIGTDQTGTFAIGNAGFGVLIYQGAANTIGGSNAGEGNVIAASYAANGYTGIGISIEVPNATNNVIKANFIGTNGPGTTKAPGTLPLGNAGPGVFIDGPIGEQIGGTAVGDANTIAFNGQDGVWVLQGSAVSILGNSIHDNGGLGIDLASGTNDNQAAPVLTSVVGETSPTITGTLATTAGKLYRIEFFASAAPASLSNSAGQALLGSILVTGDGTNKSFTASGLKPIPVGQYFLTATATVATPNGNSYIYGDTSAFSAYLYPNVLMVNTTADSGTGSLRAAITQADTDAALGLSDVINFAPSLAGAPIVLTSGQQLELSGAGLISIDGRGLSSPVTISGKNATRVFQIDSGLRVELDNLTITAGRDSSGNGGGGIHNKGTLTVSGCTLSTSTSSTYGGGIWNGGTLTLNASTLSGNSESGTGAGGGGGGVYNKGTLTVQNGCSFSNNLAYSNGGGIFNDSTGTITVDSTTLSGNAALNGGGIYNVSTQSASVSGGGSVIANSISNSILDNNWAKSFGGGISNPGNLTVSNSTFAGNWALYGGGIGQDTGRVLVSVSTLSGNSASVFGGGLYNQGGYASLTQCTLANNMASAGGAVANNQSRTASGTYINGTLFISNDSLYQNKATNGGGGGIDNIGSTITLDRTTIALNQATSAGGGIYNAGTITVQSQVPSAIYGNQAPSNADIYGYAFIGPPYSATSVIGGCNLSTAPESLICRPRPARVARDPCRP